MLDSHGNILTHNKAVRNRAVEGYKDRMMANKMMELLADKEEEVNELCERRLELTKRIKSNLWNMGDLEEAIKDRDRTSK